MKQKPSVLFKGKNSSLKKIFDEASREETIIEKYSRQMAEKHAKKLDDNFWLVVKQRPKWMPKFIYRAVIKELIELNQYK